MQIIRAFLYCFLFSAQAASPRLGTAERERWLLLWLRYPLPTACHPEVGAPDRRDPRFCCQRTSSNFIFIEPRSWIAILCEHVCDLVLSSWARYFSGTINYSEYSLYFRKLVSNLYTCIPYFSVLEVAVRNS